MLLVRRGEGLPGAGEAFSGAGDEFPGAAAADAAVVAELTREAICRLRACWVVPRTAALLGAASSEGVAISKQQRLAKTAERRAQSRNVSQSGAP